MNALIGQLNHQVIKSITVPRNPSLFIVSHYSCYDLHVSDSVGIEIVKKIQTLNWE